MDTRKMSHSEKDREGNIKKGMGPVKEQLTLAKHEPISTCKDIVMNPPRKGEQSMTYSGTAYVRKQD